MLITVIILGFVAVICVLQKQEDRRFDRDYDERHQWDEFHESRSLEDINRSYLCAGTDERKERSWPI